MTLEQLRLEIPRLFPEVPKPDFDEMMEHGSECICCCLLWNDAMPLSHPIPDSEAFWLNNESQCLSPIGYRCLVPSLLESALRTASQKKSPFDSRIFEMMIIGFATALSYESEVRRRMSQLDREQVHFLIRIVECAFENTADHDIYGMDMLKAMKFLNKLFPA